jgi:hypothetical protein
MLEKSTRNAVTMILLTRESLALLLSTSISITSFRVKGGRFCPEAAARS